MIGNGTSDKDFTEQLGRYPAWAIQGLGIRATLRALFHSRLAYQSDEILLSTLQSLFISYVGTRFADSRLQDVSDIAAQIASRTVDLVKDNTCRSIVQSAFFVSAYGTNQGGPELILAAIKKSSEYMPEREEFTTRSVGTHEVHTKFDFWSNINIDLDILSLNFTTNEYIESSSLISRRLWNSPNRMITMSKDDFLRQLEAKKPELNWNIWKEWLSRRFDGYFNVFENLDENSDRQISTQISSETLNFWDRPAAEVNADICARVEVARLQEPEPTVRQPASVKPVWHNNKLIQDDGISSDASLASLDALLEGIGGDFATLADSMSGKANISESALGLLNATAEQISAAGLDRKKLFRLTNRLLALQYYGVTVREEWKPEYGAQYHALVAQLDNLLRTFPDIQDFMTAVPKPERTLHEVQTLEEIGAQIIESLQADEVSPVIDMSIVEAVRESHQAVSDDLGPWIGSLSSNSRRSIGSVENMLGGLSNILGELGNRALKSLQNKGGEHADKTGDYATDASVYIFNKLKMTSKAGAVGAASAATALATNIEILAQASAPLGILISLLTYIALSKSSSEKK